MNGWRGEVEIFVLSSKRHDGKNECKLIDRVVFTNIFLLNSFAVLSRP